MQIYGGGLGFGAYVYVYVYCACLLVVHTSNSSSKTYANALVGSISGVSSINSVCAASQKNNNKQRWDAAVRTLEETAESRSRRDRRAGLASLVGLYVDADTKCNHSKRHDQSSPTTTIGDQSQSRPRSYGVDAIVAVQPDRSAGRKLIFLDAATGQLLGFVLLETTSTSSSAVSSNVDESKNDTNETEANETNGNAAISTLRGIEVEGWARGRGYSNLFLGVWLNLCLQGNVVPATVSINKPLLALALCRFGFTPSMPPVAPPLESTTTTTTKKNKRKRRSVRKMPISIEIHVGKGPTTDGDGDDDAKVEIYCDKEHFADLEAGFTAGELRHQKLALTRTPPCPRGEPIQIRTQYVAPPAPYHDHPAAASLLRGLCLGALQGECSPSAAVAREDGLACNNNILRQKEAVSRSALIGRLRGFQDA